jgi:AmiR/NasT family two-component response regulator
VIDRVNGSDVERLISELRTKNAQLETALSSRIVIEQAKGVLAGRYSVDLDRAFSVLRGAARSNRMKIHELAQAVVTSPRTPTPIEVELARGRVVRRPFPASASS